MIDVVRRGTTTILGSAKLKKTLGATKRPAKIRLADQLSFSSLEDDVADAESS